MQSERNVGKQPVFYYGKKYFYLNPLIARKEFSNKVESEKIFSELKRT